MPGCPPPNRTRRTLALALSTTALLACGGTSEDEQRQRLADDLMEETDGALGEDSARCVADALHDQYGDESFERVLRAAEDEDADEDVRTQVIDIFAGCDALEPIIDNGS